MSKGSMQWVIFAALAIIWGSSFILMKRALLVFDFWEVGLLRMVSATIVTLFFAFPALKEFRRKDFPWLLTVGLFGNGLPYLLFPLAVVHVDSAVVGILNSLVPLFTVVIGFVFFKAGSNFMQLLGILTGLLGATWLIAPWNAELSTDQLLYTTLPVIATIQYAISINVIGQKLSHLSTNAITLLAFMTIFFPAAISLSFFTNFFHDMSTHPDAWTAFMYVAILGIVGTSIAVVFFNKLIKMTTTVFASSITYCIPIVAILWGAADGEELGIRHVAGVLMILLGVYLVNANKQKRTESLK